MIALLEFVAYVYMPFLRASEDAGIGTIDRKAIEDYLVSFLLPHTKENK